MDGPSEGSGSYRNDEGMQTVAHAVGRVKLGEHHGVRGRLPQVSHPELGSLKVWRVDDELLEADKQVKRRRRRKERRSWPDLGHGVIGRGGPHGSGVAPVAQFRQGEAAEGLQAERKQDFVRLSAPPPSPPLPPHLPSCPQCCPRTWSASPILSSSQWIQTSESNTEPWSCAQLQPKREERPTHPLVQEELAGHGPVVHAQTVVEEQDLQRVGHHVLLRQEVIAEELLHPGQLQPGLDFLHTHHTEPGLTFSSVHT